MCPLCHSENCTFHYLDAARNWQYYLCKNCHLIYLDPKQRVDAAAEKRRYDEHNNTLADPRYLNFVNTLVETTLPYLQTNDFGLDFGCGIAAPVAHLLEQKGFKMDRYDPYYFRNRPSGPYDFVLATEVIEHLYHPPETIDFIKSLTKPNGLVGFKSSWHKADTNFSKWFYRNDDTHVVFYSRITLEWIAQKWNFEILELSDREVLYRN